MWFFGDWQSTGRYRRALVHWSHLTREGSSEMAVAVVIDDRSVGIAFYLNHHSEGGRVYAAMVYSRIVEVPNRPGYLSRYHDLGTGRRTTGGRYQRG